MTKPLIQAESTTAALPSIDRQKSGRDHDLPGLHHQDEAGVADGRQPPAAVAPVDPQTTMVDLVSANWYKFATAGRRRL